MYKVAGGGNTVWTHTEGSTYFIINRHNCCKYHRDSTCFPTSFSPNLILMQIIKWCVTSVNIYNQPKSATYKSLPSLWSRGGQIDISILSVQSLDLSINTTTIAPIGSVTKQCIHHMLDGILGMWTFFLVLDICISAAVVSMHKEIIHIMNILSFTIKKQCT